MNRPAITSPSKMAIGRNSTIGNPLRAPATTRIVKQRSSAAAGRPQLYMRWASVGAVELPLEAMEPADIRAQISPMWCGIAIPQ